MIISHNFNANGFLTNNEIWFKATADLQVSYFTFIFRNLNNNKISTPFYSYTNSNNEVSINIQSIVKSLMDAPNNTTNNSSKIEITIKTPEGTTLVFNKDFVRGGRRTNDTNQTTPPNQSLRLSQKLPVWAGFPISDYFLNSSYQIIEQNLSQVTNIDYRRIKGCNNIYLKFLNQKGGYSFWVFESYEEKETASNVGYLVDKNNNLLDLGNESKSDLKVFSKIPREYKDYAKDLIVSPDVYAYQNGGWKKIFLKGNNIEVDNIKKVYSMNINIDLNYRYNPSLLW